MSKDTEFEEKRKYERYKTMWKILYKDHWVGHLEDISLEGAKIAIDKAQPIIEEGDFYIKIQPPEGIDLIEIRIKIAIIWENTDDRYFVLYGARIVEIPEDYVYPLKDYIRLFNKEIQ